MTPERIAVCKCASCGAALAQAFAKHAARAVANVQQPGKDAMEIARHVLTPEAAHEQMTSTVVRVAHAIERARQQALEEAAKIQLSDIANIYQDELIRERIRALMATEGKEKT